LFIGQGLVQHVLQRAPHDLVRKDLPVLRHESRTAATTVGISVVRVVLEDGALHIQIQYLPSPVVAAALVNRRDVRLPGSDDWREQDEDGSSYS
jgi:hypothetical protein